jgi:hypothetical protein
MDDMNPRASVCKETFQSSSKASTVGGFPESLTLIPLAIVQSPDRYERLDLKVQDRL